MRHWSVVNAEELAITFSRGRLANGVCRSRIRDMFNVRPPYMGYWAASAA